MSDERHAVEPDPLRHSTIPASTVGTAYCILSALFYTLMGICQRELSTDCDPVWVNCVQASASTVVFGVFLAFQSARGRPKWPPMGVISMLILLGAVTQLGGSAYQWSLGVVGLAIGNPLQMGVMLAATAILGLFILRERVSWRGAVAIALITVAVLLLSLGADAANEAVHREADIAAGSAVTDSKGAPGVGLVLLGVGAASLAGVAFAVLTVGIRKTATENTSAAAIVFFINLMGILFLGPWAVQRLGIEQIMATSSRDLVVMLAVGACNLLGFLLLTKALQLTTAVRVNVINNALTTVLSVAAGIAIFAEPANRELLLGVPLALVGIILISSSEARE